MLMTPRYDSNNSSTAATATVADRQSLPRLAYATHSVPVSQVRRDWLPKMGVCRDLDIGLYRNYLLQQQHQQQEQTSTTSSRYLIIANKSKSIVGFC